MSVEARRTLPPYRIKVVEPIPFLDTEQRRQAFEDAGYNPFNLRADQITIDLLSDSGTGATSDAQEAAAALADESYAGARSWFRFRNEVHDLTGYPFILPVHQGRAGERILFSSLLKPGQICISNTHFDTTHANVELAGAQPVDLPCPAAAHLDSDDPFKGDVHRRLCRHTTTRKQLAPTLVAPAPVPPGSPSVRTAGAADAAPALVDQPPKSARWSAAQWV
jgi:tryptophanase